MRKQTVIWTALPNGRTANGALRLSVFVSPRLRSDETGNLSLQMWPDFLNWPDKAVTFGVKFGGGPALPATVTPRTPVVQPWTHILGPTTVVVPYQPETANNMPVRSFPAAYVHSFLKDTYCQLGVLSPTERPTVAMLAARTGLGKVALNAAGLSQPVALAQPGAPATDSVNGSFQRLDLGRVKQVRQSLNQTLQKKRYIPVASAPEPTADFVQLKDALQVSAVHKRKLSLPVYDFHDIVAAMAEYPELMRDLRLIYDLTVDITGQNVPGESTVQVVPTWQKTLTTQTVAPKTAYKLTASGFTARSNDPQLVAGNLNLSDPVRTSVMEVDLVNAATAVMDVADRVVQLDAAFGGETEMALPALSSSGMAVAQLGLAERVVARIDRAAELNRSIENLADNAEPQVPVLYQEDLTRGYRLDVFDGRTKQWRSLCARKGTYKLSGVSQTLTYTDEGWVNLSVGHDPEALQLLAPESQFTWNGWSLSVPRPGKTIGTSGEVLAEEEGATQDYGLKVDWEVPAGTLPRQRFGVAYRFRARAVDLAGNSRPLDGIGSPGDANATAEVVHRRYDPVLPPYVVPKTALTRGETAERIVIHSTPGTPSAEISVRHIGPPRISQAMAEKLGYFDTATGLNAAAWQTIVDHDVPFVYEGADGTGTVQPVTSDLLPMTYLPDLFARGAAFRNLPGAPHVNDNVGALTKADFLGNTGTWLQSKPFRLIVKEGSGSPEWRSAERELIVCLPKAEVRDVKLSCYPGLGDFGMLGMWEWVYGATPAAQRGALSEKALNGLVWQITAPRTIELVHAVQKPLFAPQFENLEPVRVAGSTSAAIRGMLSLSGKSTGKLDMLAEWDELVDEPGMEVGETVHGTAHVAEIRAIDRLSLTMFVDFRHEFGDTKRRKVRYKPVATTRFREYFVDDRQPPNPMPDLTARPDHWYEVDVPSSARPAPPKVAYVIPTFKRVPVQSNTTTGFMRKGGLRVYLERPWYSSGIDERLGVVVQPSSGDTPAALKPYVTQWGEDPIWRSSPVPSGPTIATVKGASEERENLQLAENSALMVDVAGYPVGWDPDRRLWYADIELNAPQAYSAFVRLALVRLQPNAVLWREISPVVLADFAQLSAERTATVVSVAGQPAKVTLTVSGTATGNPTAAGLPMGNPMVISVEQLPAGATVQEATEMTWLPAAGGDLLVNPTVQASGGHSTWTTTITLPAARGSRPFRLVIREYERFESDPGSAAMTTAAQFLERGRMVYAESLIL